MIEAGQIMNVESFDKLAAVGWQQRFSASGTRLTEAIEEYRGIGFEIKTIPVTELPPSECSICFEDETDQSVMIFVRPAASPVADELFDDER